MSIAWLFMEKMSIATLPGVGCCTVMVIRNEMIPRKGTVASLSWPYHVMCLASLLRVVWIGCGIVW